MAKTFLTVLALVAAMSVATATRSAWTRMERVHPEATLSVSIAVVQKNLDILEDIFWAVSHPESPRYGKFLSRAEVAELTANPEATATIVAHLKRSGVKSHMMTTTKAGEWIQLVAPAATLEKVFGGEFHAYQAKNGRRVTRVESISMPGDVLNAIDTLLEVNDFPHPRAFVSKKFVRAWPKTEVADGDALVIPSLLQSFYKINKPWATPNKKNSDSVFECQQQYFTPSDLTQFQTTYGLPQVPVANVTGGNESSNPGLEAELDVQYIAATGVNVPTTFWYVPGGSTNPFPTVVAQWAAAIADDDVAPLVHSMSYGIGESELTGTTNNTLTRINTDIQKLGVRGISVLVASGDSGVAGREANDDPTQCGFDASWPTSIPFLTSVGATQWFNGDPSQGEITCSIANSPAALITSGGGFSKIWKRQSYQQAVWQKWYTPARVISGQQTYEQQYRGVPDVSLNGHNYQIVSGGSVEAVDGTSCSTPALAGIIALINDRLLNAGKSPMGFLNPTLYSLYATTPAAFNDITRGNNECTEGICCTQGYSAVAGWDPATGLGTVNMEPLYEAVLKLKGVSA